MTACLTMLYHIAYMYLLDEPMRRETQIGSLIIAIMIDGALMSVVLGCLLGGASLWPHC